MFKVKHLFTIKYLLLLHITLFLVHFHSCEVIRSQSLKVSKTYQNNKVTSIQKLLGVSNSFSLYYEKNIALSLKFQRLLSKKYYYISET